MRMIKVNGEKGKFKVEGNKPTVKAELSTLLQFLVDECQFTDEEIDECVKVSRMDAKEKVDIMLKKLFDSLFCTEKEDDDGE